MSSGIVESSSQGQQGQGQQGQGGKRSKLVERLLDASSNLPAFMKDLLNTMAVTVAGTEAAGFLIERQGDPSQPGPVGLRTITHIRPDDSDDEVRAAAIRAFTEIILPCLQQNKDGAIEVGSPDGGEPQFCLVTLLRNEGNAVAAAAVITRCRDHERARQRLMSMQLVAGYFELYMLRRQMDQSRELAVRHQNVLQLTTSVATAEGFEAAAMNFCNELANRAGASRVSVGWVKGTQIKVRALSHTEKFDKKQELIVRIQRVMEECLDQEEPVRFDADGNRSDNVTRESEALLRMSGDSSVYSVPLRRRAELVGVVVLEFSPPNKLTDEVANALAVTADLLAPQLWDRHENDRWIAVKVGKSVATVGKMAVGPKHVLAKLIFVLLLGVGLTLFLYKPMYRISAPFQFAPAQKRTLSAPFDGFIEKVHVKAGQRFVKDQLLVAMDASDSKKKLVKAQAVYAEALAEYQRELSNKEDANAVARAQLALVRARGAQADIDLYQAEINRAVIRAPFDGMVLRGELDDKEGARVGTGDPMLEIQKTGEAMEAELAVAERDVHWLREMPADEAERKKSSYGWRGRLAANSLPDREVGFSVKRIVPVGDANAKETDNTFRVIVVLDEQPDFIKPGMAGEARIDAANKPLGWIWTHRLWDWMKLKLWW
ncbi:MAG: HlyD family efflux transporter periplasmic adaptor subunit [Phycisphaerae bacterium]